MKFYTFLLLCSLLLSHHSWGESRLGLRLSAAQFQGTSQNSTVRKAAGSKTYVLAPDITYLYAVDKKVMLGAGLDAYYSAGNLDIWGMRVLGRYYLTGAAKPTIVKQDLLELKQMPKHSSYVGAEFRRYSYSLGSNPSELGEYELQGQYYNISVIGGYEMVVNPKFSYNAEFSYAPLSFSATDNRIVARGAILYFGINYFFAAL